MISRYCKYCKNSKYCKIFYITEYYKIFKNINFKEHLLTAASDFFKTAIQQGWAAASILTLLLSSDNLLTGYEQLSY